MQYNPEFKKPLFMNLRKLVLLKILIISIIFFSTFLLKNDNHFLTLSINIEGNGAPKYIDSLDILNDCPLLLEYCQSEGKMDINTKLLEDSISSIDYVYNAEVYLQNNDLTILIEQNNPFLRLGKLYYLNREGDKILATNMNASDVLFFSGDIEDGKFNEICELSNYIYKDSFMNSLIKGVHYDKDTGYILYPRLFDIQIIFGNVVQIESKFNKIKTFYKKISKSSSIIDQAGDLKIQKINVNYRDQIICQRIIKAD